MSIGRYTIKIFPGKEYYRRFTHLTEEYSETEKEIDLGQHGKLLVTEIVTWAVPLNDFSNHYGRMFIRDSANDSIIAKFTEDNLRLLNKRTYGTFILHMVANETTLLDFNRGYYDLETVYYTRTASGSYGASCAIDVVDATARNTGACAAGAAANGSNSGNIDWSDLGNMGVDDAAYTTVALTNGQYSVELDLTNFGFNLGMETQIDGIEVVLNRIASAAYIEDYIIQLKKNGTLVGNNKAVTNGTKWATGSDEDVTYGGSSDKWGTSWTAHDLCQNKFGLTIQVKANGGSATAKLDYVTIKIYYSNVGKITAASGTPFSGWSAGDLVHVASSTNSNDGIYKIGSATDTVLTFTAKLFGTDNATDTSISISKVTLDETNVGCLVRGPAMLEADEATY